MDNGAALPVLNVVAAVSWRYNPFIQQRPSCENGGHQAPVLLLQILPACGLALQGGQCQFDPFGVLGVGLLEVLELGRDYGVILHIDEGAGQVGGEP